MGRVILQHVYMYLSFNSVESVIDYQYVLPKIWLKSNKEIKLDISEPKLWSKYHKMSFTENYNTLQLTKSDKEAFYNGCEFKEP